MHSRPLKVGIFISVMVGGMRDGALRWIDIQAMAQRAESLGFDSFWIPDHLLFRDRSEPAHGPWECWSLLSAIAASTSSLEIGSLVSCVAFRNPALMAKIADTVDEISGGRLTLGLGAGWHEPEYRAYGYPFDHRFERFEEALQIIRTLLREGAIDFDGIYYQARECELRPRGPRPNGPPILIGALASRPRMLRLAARYADFWNGWLVHSRSHPDEVPALQDAVADACAHVGRDPATLARTVGIAVDQRDPRDRPPPAEGGASPLTGSIEEIAEAVRAFARAGVTHLQVCPILNGVAGVEAFAPVLELLDRA